MDREQSQGARTLPPRPSDDWDGRDLASGHDKRQSRGPLVRVPAFVEANCEPGGGARGPRQGPAWLSSRPVGRAAVSPASDRDGSQRVMRKCSLLLEPGGRAEINEGQRGAWGSPGAQTSREAARGLGSLRRGLGRWGENGVHPGKGWGTVGFGTIISCPGRPRRAREQTVCQTLLTAERSMRHPWLAPSSVPGLRPDPGIFQGCCVPVCDSGTGRSTHAARRQSPEKAACLFVGRLPLSDPNTWVPTSTSAPGRVMPASPKEGRFCWRHGVVTCAFQTS